jgi:lysozyme
VRWDRAAEAGIHFAYAKATSGERFVDPRFHENWHGMRTAGVHRGAYHFYYAAEDPRAQAKHFIATIGKLRSTDLPPMLDVEISDHTDKKAVLEGTLIWLETVEKALGKRPVLYTDPGFGDQYLKDARLSNYRLWIADYATEVSSIPSPWKKAGWTIWQHSQKGTVQGVAGEVDLNVFNGTLNDLKTFVTDSRPGLNRIPYAHNVTGATRP